MFRTPHRTKGAPALGALGQGHAGPFGEYGANDVDEYDVQADDEQPDGETAD
ncbi:hypothetical protein [Streptomyces sp. NPDC057403]|uniref:hypothetical protein n=1 Tax=Streptomyces sp. NPDC057403 TaxID=3346119 RepID=UPI0036B8F8E1